MSVTIETLIHCDKCGDMNGSDDREQTAKRIRASRKEAGWIQRGSKDYCEVCAPTIKRNKL